MSPLTHTAKVSVALSAVCAVCSGISAAEQFRLSPKPVAAPFELRARLTTGKSKAPAVIVLDYADVGDYLEVALGASSVTAHRVKGGTRTLLAEGAVRPTQATDELEVRIRRTAGRIAIGWDGVCVASVQSPASTASRIGIRNPEDGARLDQLKIQKLGEVVFCDDFMRAETDSDPWHAESGEWRLSSLRLPRFSVNAFCYSGKGDQALATTGHDFWADYLLTAAVRVTEDTDAVGLVFSARDLRSFCRFEWTRMDRGGVFQLVRRCSGKEEVLAKRDGVLVAGQWYELEVLTAGPRIEAGVDRCSLLRLDAPELYGGKAGLWCRGPSPAYFDDVRAIGIDEARHEQPFAQLIPRREPIVRDSFAGDKYMHTWTDRSTSTAKGTLLDYTFHYAPVDWRVYTGQWGIMSRWACQPRWTWFGGRGPQSVVVWHKDEFVGDVSAEIFFAPPMDSPFDPVYRHPGNVNITICGDGQNLDSGYSFVFAGWGSRWTRLLRCGEIVAETNEHLMPSNRDEFHYKDLHINWRGLRIQRSGSGIACFLNDNEILRWRDPKPLTGRKVAVWTFDNVALLTRARIVAARVEPGREYDHFGVVQVRNAHPGDRAEREAAKSVRGVRRWDFERSAVEWLRRDGAQGAALRLDGTTRSAGRSSLKLINVKSGGTFAASVPIAGIDASRSTLSFDYCVGPDVKVNLYVKVCGWWYVIGFTAPEVKWWRAPLIGRFGNVRADGKWHRTSFNLGAHFGHDRLVLPNEEQAPSDEPLTIEDAFLGLKSDDTYLLCGFGCNHAGATYHIDNFAVGARASRVGRAHQKEDAALPVVGTAHPTFIACDRWQPLGGSDGLRILSTPWERPNSSRCLLLVNEKLGGIAGAVIRSEPFDAAEYPIVSFDYKADDVPRLDFHVELAFGDTLADRWRTVKFTDHDYAWDIIGNAGEIKTDGQWHHCEFDLAKMLRKNGDDPTVTRLLLASGGYPGNEEGAHLCVGNFRLVRALAPARTPEDAEPPAVADLSPGDGSVSGKCRVAARLHDRGSGIVPASIRLTVAGRPYSLSDAVLQFDTKTGALTWDGLAARPRPVTFGDGATVQCRIDVADRAGNRLTEPCVWRWRMSHALDKTPPAAPRAVRVQEDHLLWQEFEQEAPNWGDWGSCDVGVTKEVSAVGSGSLAITHFNPSRGFLALCDVKSVPVNRFPYVAFDYLVEPVPDVPEDHYGFYMLIFDGQRDRRMEVGLLTSKDAGKWRHVEFDLRKIMTEGMGAPFGLLVGERGKKYPRPGNRIYVDNFAVYSRAGKSVRVKWSVPADASGIAGFNWCLDQKPDTVPGITKEQNVAEARFDAVPPGTHYFHVRAKDGAGNWGATGDREIVVE